MFLVEVEVDPGRCYDFDNGTEDMGPRKKNWESKGYDSATARHPTWNGVWKPPFTEYCIANTSRITIIRVEGLTKKLGKKLAKKGWDVNGSVAENSDGYSSDDNGLSEGLGKMSIGTYYYSARGKKYHGSMNCVGLARTENVRRSDT